MTRRLVAVQATYIVSVLLVSAVAVDEVLAVQRKEISYLRGPYNTALFWRHNASFRTGAALHFSHAKQHDVLLLTPWAQHRRVDAAFDAESVAYLNNKTARTEPVQEYYAPYTARTFWTLLRAIDWTHMLHEQTYDILSDRDIPWPEKKRWIDRAVRYYLDENDIPRSPAPLDVTMRRAGVMMKPYFTLFRNYYPRSNNFFYGAHWWHPIIYEAMMVGGNDGEQERVVQQTEALTPRVMRDRPQRMLLLREAAPRYSRLTPESANIFDNLHMLHGIAYDILAYEGWTLKEKQREMERIIHALGYQQGDEQLARKFAEADPDLDPRVYPDWMKGTEGEMTRIMMEMIDEMMPLMMPPGTAPGARDAMMAQLRMKLTPGLQDGEIAGSLMDAMMAAMPDMRMMPESREPGTTPFVMVDAMLRGWRERSGMMPDIAPMPMDRDPAAPPLPAGIVH